MKLIYSFCVFTALYLCPLQVHGVDALVSRHQLRLSELPAPGKIASRYEHIQLNTTEIKLANGMRILIKPTDFEEDEVLIHMYALGGYGSLSPQQLTSGRLAALAAWESGIGPLNKQELDDLLYREGVDLKLKIKLAQRTIEASTCENGLKTVFKLIHLIFTRTAPNTDGMNRVLASSIDVLKLRDRDPNQVFEDLLLKVNTGDHFLLRPMEQEAVALASTESTKDFFQRCYGNPADFTIVIVGDCDVERVLDLAQRYLANLQATRPSFSEPTRIDLPFPHHALKHRVRESKEWDDVTVLTLELPFNMDQDCWVELDALTQSVEARIRRRLKEQFGSNLGFDCAYEYPLFPDPSVCWMTMRFQTHPRKTDQVSAFILSEIERLQRDGLSEEEWQEVKRLLRDNDALWAKENCFWMAMIANYSKWGWSLNGLTQRQAKLEKIRKEEVQELLKQLIQTTRHTAVTVANKQLMG